MPYASLTMIPPTQERLITAFLARNIFSLIHLTWPTYPLQTQHQCLTWQNLHFKPHATNGCSTNDFSRRQLDEDGNSLNSAMTSSTAVAQWLRSLQLWTDMGGEGPDRKTWIVTNLRTPDESGGTKIWMGGSMHSFNILRIQMEESSFSMGKTSQGWWGIGGLDGWGIVVKTLIEPRKRYLVISICRWRGTYSMSLEPKHHSETDSLKLFKLFCRWDADGYQHSHSTKQCCATEKSPENIPQREHGSKSQQRQQQG